MGKIVLLIGLVLSSTAYGQLGPRTEHQDKFGNPVGSSRQESDRYVTRDAQNNAKFYEDSHGVIRRMNGNIIGFNKTQR